MNPPTDMSDGDDEEAYHRDDKDATAKNNNKKRPRVSQSVEDDNVKDEEESSKTSEFVPSSRTKLRKKKSYDAIDPGDSLPSFARKTERGGYAHTNKTKSKISQANTGNTPWNKGSNRSSADKAKIAAGVRARNRAILLEKLKRLGLSEEEWYAKKKEIKYLRERVRRAKLSTKRQEQAEAERNLQAVIDATTEKPGSSNELDLEVVPSVGESIPPGHPPERTLKKRKAASKLSRNLTGKISQTVVDEQEESDVDDLGDAFAKEVDFRPYSFGPNGESYDHACPTGGPGGFICCEECANKYSWYLSNTVKDMEIHRTTRNGREVEELLCFLPQARTTLIRAYSVAQKKIAPLPKTANVATRPSGVSTSMPHTKRAGTSVHHHHHPTTTTAAEGKQWNITSTLDVGMANNISQMEMV